MHKAAKDKIMCCLALGIATILSTGCIVDSHQAVKTGEVSQEDAAPLKRGPSESSQRLIKPTIAEEPQNTVQPDSGPQSLPTAQPVPAPLPAPAEHPRPEVPPQLGGQIPETSESTPPGPPPQTQPTGPDAPVAGGPAPTRPKPFMEGKATRPQEKREWEDQKVKEAAIELAKGLPQVAKIKVCYAVKDDEWWVVFYENAGAFTELKQYTWNRDLEKLEVYLVVKRIPSTRVQQHLVQEEAGKACEILEVPRTTGSVQ